jgi:hypothetical protein
MDYRIQDNANKFIFVSNGVQNFVAGAAILIGVLKQMCVIIILPWVWLTCM